MSTICPACGSLEESSSFCTTCGSGLVVSEQPAQPTQPTQSAQPAQTQVSATAGPSTLDKVVNGIDTTMTVVVGIVWMVIGIGAIVAAFSGVAIGFLIGPLVILYAIYLIKPGGWKLIIY